MYRLADIDPKVGNCVLGVMMFILIWFDLILLIVSYIILLEPDLLEFLNLITSNRQVIIV